MQLPKIETPKYSLTVPSSKETVEYRPFLVKEEKILLVAQQSDDQTEQFNAIKNLIQSCTFNKVSGASLTNYDIEYIFLKLRAKSVGETSSVNIKCTECDKSTPISIDLSDIEVQFPTARPSNKIMLTDSIGIIAKDLSTDDISSLSKKGDNQVELLNATIRASIESIFDDENVYPVSETTESELEEFIDSLNREQMSKIEAYLESTPKLQKEIKFTCPHCKAKNETMLEGVQSFFE